MNEGKLLMSGAIAGVATPLLMKYLVSPILNMIGQFTPVVTAKLANPQIDINISQSLTGINTGLSTWLTNALGVTVPANIWTLYGMAAVGAAILFLAGGWAVEQFKLGKNAQEKTAWTIFSGSVGAALIMGTMALPVSLGITFVNVLIAFGINAVALAILYALLEKNIAEVGLMPY